jgi:hypothetical protein
MYTFPVYIPVITDNIISKECKSSIIEHATDRGMAAQ